MVPEKGELYAPADGVIESVFGTKHAISMKTAAGAELLMHIGMDTVKRDGKALIRRSRTARLSRRASC